MLDPTYFNSNGFVNLSNEHTTDVRGGKSALLWSKQLSTCKNWTEICGDKVVSMDLAGVWLVRSKGWAGMWLACDRPA